MSADGENSTAEAESPPQVENFASKIIDLIWDEQKKDNDWKKELAELLRQEIDGFQKLHGVQEYLVVFLWKDDDQLVDDDVTSVYSSLPTKSADRKKLLLLIDSAGGKIEPAYLISKACKSLSKKFCVAVPRKAKSAATLISLGANEIHMGLSSELGPIDPQIGGIPAQALSNALRAMASVVCEYPGSAEMFSKYLSDQLNLRHLGYFERLNESAVQYGSRLLGSRAFPENRSADDLARHLVNHYKDHSFVIDMDEAVALLGSEFVKQDTAEYQFSKSVQATIKFLNMLLRIKKNKKMTIVGSIEQGLKFSEIEQP